MSVARVTSPATPTVLFAPYGIDAQGRPYPPHPTQSLVRQWVAAARAGRYPGPGIPTLYLQHGVNAGGTRACLAPLLEYAFEQPGARMLIGRREFIDLRRSVMQTIDDILPPALIVARNEQVHIISVSARGRGSPPSELHFQHLGDEESLGSQQFAAILVCEVQEITERVFRALQRRARQGALPAFILLEGNPPTEGHWLIDRLTNPRSDAYDASITVLKLPSSENLSFMTPAYQEMLSSMPAAWRRRYVEAEAGFLPDGTPVYPAFIESVHVRHTSLIPDRPMLRGWDFGYRRAACYDQATELLTDRGWKRISDARVGESALTLNPHTRLMEYQPVQATISYPYTGAMYHWRDAGNAGYDVRVTEDHLMVIDRLRKRPTRTSLTLLTARQLAEWNRESSRSRLWFLRTGQWAGARIETRRLPERVSRMTSVVVRVRPAVEWPLENDAECLGWYVSEGSTASVKASATEAVQAHDCTTVWQQEADPVMAQVLEQTPFRLTRLQPQHHGWRAASAQLHEYLKPFGKSFEPYVPDVIKQAPVETIQRFLTMYERGDGSQEGDWVKMTTASPRMADDLQELYLKCGYAARITRTPYANRLSKRPLYAVSRLKTFAMRIHPSRLTVEQVTNEPVFCVTVPNHIVYVRRNGRPMWCGNCLWSQLSDAGQFLLHREWMPMETPESSFIDGVIRRTNDWFGPIACRDIGDPASRNRDPQGISTLRRLSERGIRLLARQSTYAERIPLINQRLSLLIGGEPAIIVDPACRVVIEGLLGGYHYPRIDPERRFLQRHEVPEHDQYYSHLMNCLEYLCVNLLLGATPFVQQARHRERRQWVERMERSFGTAVF